MKDAKYFRELMKTEKQKRIDTELSGIENSPKFKKLMEVIESRAKAGKSELYSDEMLSGAMISHLKKLGFEILELGGILGNTITTVITW